MTKHKAAKSVSYFLESLSLLLALALNETTYVGQSEEVSQQICQTLGTEFS